MKHVKIVGLLVALGGVVASFAAASALYVLGPNEIGFGIGATYTAADGQIDYLIDGKSSGSIAPKFLNASGSKDDGEGFGGEYTQALFEFPLSAYFHSHEQPYVAGNFEVNITNINSALFNKAHVWIQVKGWTNEYDGKYGPSAANSNFMAEDAAITSATYTTNKNIAVSSTEEENVSVYFKLDSAIDGASLLAVAESKLFDISVTWQQVTSDYKFAYVVGNKTAWEEDEVYAMQPNLKVNEGEFGWWYSGLTGFSTAKVKKETTWAPNDDQTLNPEHHYNVAWNGGEEGTEGYYCSFTDLDAA